MSQNESDFSNGNYRELKRKCPNDPEGKKDQMCNHTSVSDFTKAPSEVKAILPAKRRSIPPKKISLNLSSKSSAGNSKHETPKVQPLSEDVAQVFGEDESDEEDEMPVEARIRMRNKGRETPTSSGPNSFGKSRYGFIDRRALQNKQLEALNEMVSGDNEDD
nr:PEST proteolytic signal containing nuclear [Hymenolepis microstoma]